MNGTATTPLCVCRFVGTALASELVGEMPTSLGVGAAASGAEAGVNPDNMQKKYHFLLMCPAHVERTWLVS